MSDLWGCSVETKICAKCSETKAINSFRDNRKMCVECERKQNKIYKENHKEEIKLSGKKWREHNKEQRSKYMAEWAKDNRDKRRKTDLKYKESNRHILKEKSKTYYHNNKENISLKNKEHYANNKEDILKRRKIYRDNNKEHLKELYKINYQRDIRNRRIQRNRYLKKLRDTNENYRISGILRTSLRNALKKRSITKTFKSGITTASVNEILMHIGDRPSECYHLDHIIPMCKFDLRIPRHRELVNSKYNLRWLLATENLQKNDFVDEDLISRCDVLVSISKEIGLTLEK